jgi:hypothetical protein
MTTTAISLQREKPKIGWRWNTWRIPETRLYFLVVVLSLASSLAAVLFGRIPIANGADEFSYLLGGQTFAAGRLTNPTHPYWEFFESFHVLSRPSYIAKYPPAQSLALALGYKLGHPILGVWLCSAAFAAAAVYLFRARLNSIWSLVGGCLVVLQFGSTHYYTQSYWGGAIGATAGALILGATLRLCRTPGVGAAIALGAGIGLGALSRPFETVVICVVPGFYLARTLLRKADRMAYLRKYLGLTAPIIALALGFQARFNVAVTGDWWRLPYTVYEHQYSGTPFFVWQPSQPKPEFHNEVFSVFHQYFIVATTRFDRPVPIVWLRRITDMVVSSVGPVLAIGALLATLLYRTRSAVFLGVTVLFASVASMGSYWYISHYYAGIHAACVFLGVHALRAIYLARPAGRFSRELLFLPLVAGCLIARVQGDWKLRPFIDRLAYVRREIQGGLDADAEKHLIFVRRVRPYNFHFIWVHNGPDIDASKVVWAHDRGATENARLLDHYHGTRRVWLLVEGNDQPQLQPYAVTVEK